VRQPYAAWQDGHALIVAFPSSSKIGVYLVRAEKRADGRLVITHACPAARHQKKCWHVEAMKELYFTWRFWEDVQDVLLEHRPVILRPEWRQIPIPGTEGAIIDEVAAKKVKHVAKRAS